MNNLSDQQIIDSWKKNVKPWVAAVREGEIESRLLITNQAIIDAIIERKPATVLDVGCGEGWLVRELSKSGINAMGVDVVPELIEAAEKEGGGRYSVLSFEALSNVKIKEKFDVIVCNFSLLGNESVIHLFEHVASLLNEGGSFIVQTIHPVTGCGDNEYEDGWREGSWAGFSDEFCDPAPWYFRTLETWQSLFLSNGFGINNTLESLNPKTQIPASVIFIGEITDK